MNPALTTPESELRERLGLDGAAARRAWTRRLAWIAVLLAAAAIAAVALAARSGAPEAARFRTEPAAVGDLVETVAATGTLEALDTVEVGSEVSGRVVEVHVDFNDPVTAGQVLATLDPEEADARAEQAAAQLEAAHASLARAEASTAEAAANLRRVEALADAGLLSAQELDAARAAAERARADVASARAQATVSGASLTSARASLAKTEVRSPIDGVVLARSVEPGQTVAASLQAPVLFTLARDLARMTLSVDVDEADVGKVREGQRATFTVDAYPERVFASRVVSLRNVPKAEQDVVTYEAILAVDNGELLLRPGMTASAEIVVDEKRGELLVPNAALRFTPPEVAAAAGGDRPALRLPGIGGPRGGRDRGRPGGGEAAAAPGARRRGAAPAATVWVLRDGQPAAVPVTPGATDGVRTAVAAGELSAGDPVIVDVVAAGGAR